MNTPERKITKPASDDPWREAKGHPNGPSLMEMLNGQEEIKLRGENPHDEMPEDTEHSTKEEKGER